MTPSKELRGETDNLKRIISGAWLIAEKEIIANLRNLKIPAALVMMTSLFLLSVHLLALDYQQRMNNWTVNQTAQLDPVVGGVVRYELPNGSFYDSVGTGHEPPMQPPMPLSVLVKGMDGDVDRPISLGQQIQFGPRQDENAVSLLFEVPDIAFIVKVMISLLALFFTVDLLTREKEAGTLRILLANPLRRRELMLGKAIGASISLFVPMALAYASGLIYLYTLYRIPNNTEELLRALSVFSLSLLYGLVFIHIGLYISTLTIRTKTAIVIALLVWAGLVVALPNVTVLAAELLSPAPSYNHLRARLDEAWQQIVQAELRSHPGARTIFETPAVKQAILRRLEIDQQLTDEYLVRKWSQIDHAQRLASLSPAGALAFGSSDLAGTGRSAYRAYLEFLRSGRDLMVDALRRRWDLPPQEGGKLLRETELIIRSHKRQPEPLLHSVRSALPAIASLGVWMSLFGLAAYWRFERYDVR